MVAPALSKLLELKHTTVMCPSTKEVMKHLSSPFAKQAYMVMKVRRCSSGLKTNYQLLNCSDRMLLSA